MNKITKIKRVNVLFTNITRAEIEIILKICSLFFGHFCFVVVYANLVLNCFRESVVSRYCSKH